MLLYQYYTEYKIKITFIEHNSELVKQFENIHKPEIIFIDRKILSKFKTKNNRITLNSNNKSSIQDYLKNHGFIETKNDINEIFLDCIIKKDSFKLKIVIKYATENNVILNIN